MSLYYGRSPYLENRNGKSMFSLGKTARVGTGSFLRRKGSRGGSSFLKNFPLLQRRARRTLATGAARGTEAVKVGAEAFVGAMQAARNVGKGKMKFEFGPGSVMVGLGFVAIGLSLAYLAYFNQVATRGYEMTRLEADRQQLLNQYEIKNMKLAEVQSLSNISNSDRVSAMRRPSTVEFVRGNTALALK